MLAEKKAAKRVEMMTQLALMTVTFGPLMET
jgi:hypothetical protein